MDFLTQPYPYFHKSKTLLRNGLLVFILAYFFEYLFEPFNVNRDEHNFDYWVIVLVHTGNGVSIYLTYFFLLSFFVNEDDWKIYKEAIALLVLLLCIGVGTYLWREFIYDNQYNRSLKYFVEEIRNTILVGTIILSAITAINFRILNRQNQAKASQLVPEISEDKPSDQMVEIKANITSDHFQLNPSEVLCIRSDGNYLEFFLQHEGESKKLLKRLTLQSASEQLSDFPFIVKTHRAFLVNIHHLTEVKGNAQGYQLSMKDLEFTVPVSRAHVKNFNAVLT